MKTQTRDYHQILALLRACAAVDPHEVHSRESDDLEEFAFPWDDTCGSGGGDGWEHVACCQGVVVAVQWSADGYRPHQCRWQVWDTWAPQSEQSEHVPRPATASFA